MKKIIQSNIGITQKIKNLWFAMQLFIVAISLPVLSIVQISHKGNDVGQKQNIEVSKSLSRHIQLDAALQAKTAGFKKMD
jgi:hypothetical protein